MTDRRLLRSNGRVAHRSLQGVVSAERYEDGVTFRVAVPVADLCRAPAGARDKQLLFGQRFVVLDVKAGQAFGFDPVDGYCGYVAEAQLADDGIGATHRVATRQAHLYGAPDIKSAEIASLSYGSFLSCPEDEESGAFLACAKGGFVPLAQVEPVSAVQTDEVAVAEIFLGTPYLWGGNSGFGIDCSGLIQMAFHAAGQPCPRDSDQQERAWPEVSGRLQRGDLVFWAGHVGVLQDADTLLHANAHHMCVVSEPFEQARHRIGQKEFGEITRISRPQWRSVNRADEFAL